MRPISLYPHAPRHAAAYSPIMVRVEVLTCKSGNAARKPPPPLERAARGTVTTAGGGVLRSKQGDRGNGRCNPRSVGAPRRPRRITLLARISPPARATRPGKPGFFAVCAAAVRNCGLRRRYFLPGRACAERDEFGSGAAAAMPSNGGRQRVRAARRRRYQAAWATSGQRGRPERSMTDRWHMFDASRRPRGARPRRAAAILGEALVLAAHPTRSGLVFRARRTHEEFPKTSKGRPKSTSSAVPTPCGKVRSKAGTARVLFTRVSSIAA